MVAYYLGLNFLFLHVFYLGFFKIRKLELKPLKFRDIICKRFCLFFEFTLNTHVMHSTREGWKI